MISRYPNIWKWLPFVALGLMLVRELGPISGSLEEIFSTAIVVLMVSYGICFFRERYARRADQPTGTAVSSSDQM